MDNVHHPSSEDIRGLVSGAVFCVISAHYPHTQSLLETGDRALVNSRAAELAAA